MSSLAFSGSPELQRLIGFCSHLTIKPDMHLQDYVAFFNATLRTGDDDFIQVYLNAESKIIGSKEAIPNGHDFRLPPIDTKYVVIIGLRPNNVIHEHVPMVFSYGNMSEHRQLSEILHHELETLIRRAGIVNPLPAPMELDMRVVATTLHVVNKALRAYPLSESMP